MYWLTNIARILLQECMNQCPRCCVVCAGNWVDTVSLFNKRWRKQTKHIAVTPAKLWLNQGPNVKVWHLDLGSIKVWQVCDIAKQPSDSVLWRVILSERSRCGTAKQFSFFRRDIASQSADFDLGRFVQSELRSCDIANSLQMVTFGGRSFNESLESASILCRSASTLLARHLYRISCFKSRLMGASPLEQYGDLQKKELASHCGTSADEMMNPVPVARQYACLVDVGRSYLSLVEGPAAFSEQIIGFQRCIQGSTP